MKIGICVPHYGRPIEVGRIVEVVQRAEEQGLDSLWVTDHVIMPRDLPIIYRDHMLDPLTVLPWLAGITTKITLGTSLVVLPYRSPIVVAKTLASVDVLSGGRLIFAGGVGWVEAEFATLGVPFHERGRRADEALEVIRALWTQEYPEIETRHHRITGMKASPMPIQKPHPPIWAGGYSEGAFRRVAKYADGWHASRTSHEAFQKGIEAVSRYWAESGREGSPVWSLRIPLLIEGIGEVIVDAGMHRGRPQLQGSIDQVIGQLQGYQALGCQHVVIDLSNLSFPSLLATLDILAQQVRPQLAE
jgi:probable F420-dependent oxidoreductase